MQKPSLLEGAKVYPDTLDILLQATQFYLDTDNTDGAFEAVHRAMALDPGNYILDLVEGSLYMKLEDYPKAIESLQKSLVKNPDTVREQLQHRPLLCFRCE